MVEIPHSLLPYMTNDQVKNLIQEIIDDYWNDIEEIMNENLYPEED